MLKSYLELFRGDDELNTFKMIFQLSHIHCSTVLFSIYLLDKANNQEHHHITLGENLKNNKQDPFIETLAVTRRMIAATQEPQSSKIEYDGRDHAVFALPVFIEDEVYAITQFCVPLSERSPVAFLTTLNGLVTQFMKDIMEIHDASAIQEDGEGQNILLEEEHGVFLSELQLLLNHPTVEIKEVLQVIKSIRKLLEY